MSSIRHRRISPGQYIRRFKKNWQALPLK